MSPHHGLAGLVNRSSYSLGNTTLQTTQTIERIIFTLAGIALYNMLELLVHISLRFHHRKNLYFWSLIVSTVGILPYTLGLLFKFFGVIEGYPLVLIAIAMLDIGWQAMVTGQSVVLYSRLHLICRDRRVQRAVLWMIIANWFLSNVPTTIFVFGVATPKSHRFAATYAVWERLQLCLYFVQETIISSIYGFEVMRMLKPDFFLFSKKSSTKCRRTRLSIPSMSSFTRRMMRTEASQRVLRHLLYINALIIALDATLLVTEFIGHYEVQVIYKGFVYSIKLKMEFRILSQLTDIAQQRLRDSKAYFADPDHDDGAGRWRSVTSASHGGTLQSSGATVVEPEPELGPLDDSPPEEMPPPEKGVIRIGLESKEKETARLSAVQSELQQRDFAVPIIAPPPLVRRPAVKRIVSFTEGIGTSPRYDEGIDIKWHDEVKSYY